MFLDVGRTIGLEPEAQGNPLSYESVF